MNVIWENTAARAAASAPMLSPEAKIVAPTVFAIKVGEAQEYVRALRGTIDPIAAVSVLLPLRILVLDLVRATVIRENVFVRLVMPARIAVLFALVVLEMSAVETEPVVKLTDSARVCLDTLLPTVVGNAPEDSTIHVLGMARVTFLTRIAPA